MAARGSAWLRGQRLFVFPLFHGGSPEMGTPRDMNGMDE